MNDLIKITKPIIFNTEMVKAILDGRKTQTRRVLGDRFRIIEFITFDEKEKQEGYKFSILDKKENSKYDTASLNFFVAMGFSKYKVGDVLYVKETWCYGSVVGEDDGYGNSESWLEQLHSDIGNKKVFYKADMEDATKEGVSFENVAWKPSVHMPKKYARIFLKVTNVRVERLQDMSHENLLAEGFDFKYFDTKKKDKGFFSWWINLWNSIAKDGYKYEDNPYVFVYEFERVEK